MAVFLLIGSGVNWSPPLPSPISDSASWSPFWRWSVWSITGRS